MFKKRLPPFYGEDDWIRSWSLKEPTGGEERRTTEDAALEDAATALRKSEPTLGSRTVETRLQRQGPLAPGSTQVSRHASGEAWPIQVWECGTGEKGAGGGRWKETGTADVQKEASSLLWGGRPDSELEFEGADRRRGTEDYGGRCPTRRRNCSSKERTDVGTVETRCRDKDRWPRGARE
ncbi:hypothetical protein NDU88_007039 [Pleurodeles waltl]|uniref:Uncharacterized protein n=1 Tax=Pleurodeles waltl TaxID=8319 RepID=A0AAV7TYK2_PLEWA|nr:hypothetical protein NDU88_007039 [Pleurodeles waltl]